MNRVVCICLLLGILPFAQAGAGDELFDDRFVHELKITFSNANFWDSLTLDYQQLQTGASVNYRAASIELDGQLLDSVGIRQRGQYSNKGFPGLKKPLKIDLDRFIDEQDIDGIDKINLANFALDPSYLRDKIAYELHHLAGNVAPRSSYVQVYINNQYWGIYLMVEQIDASFLKRNFGNKDGVLFKGMDDTDLEWRGYAPSAYDEVEVKAGKEEWSGFLEFLNLFNNRSKEFGFSQKLNDHFDLKAYFKILAIDVLINNWDSYYDNGRNFYIYDDPVSGKLRWIPWDYNLSFSNYNAPIIPQDGSGDLYKPLIAAIQGNECLRTRYLKTFCELFEGLITVEHIGKLVDQQANLIGPFVETDPNGFYSYDLFKVNSQEAVIVQKIYQGDTTMVRLPGIKQLIKERINQLNIDLWREDIDCGKTDCSVCFSTQLSPNPTSGQLRIEYATATEYGTIKLNILDETGRSVYTTQLSPKNNVELLDLYFLKSGTYFIEMRDLEGNLRRSRFIKVG